MFTTLKNTLKENNNKGFTLLENILVVAIIAILLGIGAVGVAQYMDNADELERMGAAQTLYMSLQNYLVEEQKAGRLDTFNAMVNAGDTYTLFDYTSSVSENVAEKAILEENGQTFDATFANKHDGTKIVAVFYDGENKNQAEYQNIYNLFVSLGVDTGILDCQFVFEYNQTTGIVQSVFFTKEPSVKFTEDSYSTGAPTTANNVLARGEAAIGTKKQGYYGLYETSALSEKVQSIINSEVVLVNDDRIYLTFRAEKPKNGNNFNKHFQVYLKGSTDEKIKELKYNIKEVTPIGNFTEISTALDSLDMHTSGGKTKDNNGVTHISAKYVDMNDETAIYFVVLSCGEDDIFLDLAKKNELGTNPEKAEVYIKFEDGINLKSNAINPFFESVTSENGKDIYNLSCSRHLANLNKGKEINSTLDWKLLHYRVVDDINLMQYEREENHLPEVLSVVTGIDENEILADPKLGSKGLSKTQADTLPTDSTRRHFKGSVAPVLFGETGKGLQYFAGVFEGAEKNDGTKYSITGVTLIAETTKENGFFKRNQGTIQNLAFKKATVYSGFCAGIICGRNNGDIHGVDLEEFVVAHEWDSYKNLGHEKTMAETDETTVNDGGHTIDENGKIKTKNPYGYNGSMVGGICGISYQSVKNCTATRGIVYGEESFGGGIVGWAYSNVSANNDINSIENCVVTDCFVSASAKSGGIVGDCAFKISNCKVLKEDDSKLTPVGLQFRPAGKDALRRERLTKDVYPSVVASRNSSRVGGIVGFSNNSIENCVNYLDVCQKIDEGTTNSPSTDEIQNVGGIVGILGYSKKRNNSYSITNCKNYGNVTCYEERRKPTDPETKFVGGIVGLSYFPIDSCENYGNVVGVFSEGVGGIAGGTVNDIKNCRVLTNPKSSKQSVDATLKISGRKYVGGIVGVANSGTLENCYVGCEKATSGEVNKASGNIIIAATEYDPAKGSYNFEGVGGICGSCNKDGNFGNVTEYKLLSCSCYADINTVNNIDILQYCGGIVGRSFSKVNVEQSSHVGNITANKDMETTGGICGYVNNVATISLSTNSGEIKASGTMSQTGGICGYTKGATISSSTNAGEIKADGNMSNVGGIVGVNESAGLTINTVTNNAGISTKGSMIGTGGIVGNSAKAATITTAENKGAITASLTMSQTGGICGYIKGATIKLSTNSGVIVASGNMSEVGGIVGYNETSKLTAQAVTNDANITTTGEMFGVGGICGYSAFEVLIDGLTDESSQIKPTKNNGTISSKGKMSQTGGIVGSAAKKLTLKNVSNTNNGAITASAAMSQVGGIAGYLSGTTNTFTSVTNAGTISTTGTGTMSQTGGIVGAATQDLTLKTSANTNAGDIIANAEMTQVGGIAGYLSGTSNAFTSVTNAGAISTTGTGKMSQTGGVVGVATTALTLKTVENANDGAITASAAMSQVGGIAGYLSGTSNTFTSVTNAGTISTTGKGTMSLTGGIVGEVVNFLDLTFNTTKKTNTNSNVGTISASAAMTQVGGVIGQFDVAYTASYLKNSGKITGNGTLQDVGGVIGKQIGGGSYTGFINSGNIESKNKMTTVGGILGNAYGNSSITISSATNTGNILPGVNGSTNIGGIVGYISKCNFEINDSNSECSIGILNPDSPNANYVLLADAGGILGRTEDIKSGEGSKYKGIINNCKADVNISALGTKNEGIGGIAGYTRMSMDFLNCSVKGTLVAKQMGVGGLAGACVSSSIMYTNVEGCTTDVQILVKAAESNNDKYAGLIAYTKTNLTINDCITSGDIKADPGIPLKNSSGFLGYSTTADATNGGITMTNCVSYLNIYTDNKLLRGGGLFSNIDSVPFVDIHNNYAMGDITYGYAGMSGGLGGRLNTKLSGQMYNCYYGGKIIKLSNRDDIVSGDSFMNKDSVTKAYIDTQTGYLLGQLNFAQTGVFQDCYVYENCVDIEKGPYTGYENTSDNNYLTIRRIAGLKGANSFNVDNANVVYQTHRNAKVVAYKNNAILTETEYERLCFLFDKEPQYTGDPEKDIKYLMDNYKVSVKNAENWKGEDNAVRTVTFKCTKPEEYHCTIEYDGHKFEFEGDDHAFTLPVESFADGAKPILNGETLNFKIIDENSGDAEKQIKNTDLVVVNWTPDGGSSVLIKPSAEGVYTVGSVLANGEISIVIDTAPVVTYEFILEDGTAVPSADVSKYLSLESIVGMERFAGEYNRYHVTEPAKKVSFTTRMNQAGYYCELKYSNPSKTAYLAGGSVTDAQTTTVTEDVTVTYTIVKCPKIKIHYKNNLGEDLAYSNNFDVSNASHTKKFNDYSADCYSLYSAMTTPSNTDFKLKIKMKDGYKYILFDEKGEVIGKYDQESDADITERVNNKPEGFDLYLVRYPAGENWDEITTMPVSLRINLVAGDGYTWDGETSLKVKGNIDSKTTEEKKVTFTVTDTSKEVECVEIGDTKLTPVSKGENKYEVTIPVGTEVGNGDVKVIFKSEPEDITFDLNSGEGFRWEDVSGNEISSVDVAGNGEEPNKTAKDKKIYLIVNEGKVLETVKLGDTPLSPSGPTPLEGGGEKYEVTIPQGSPSGTITVTVKEKTADVKFDLSSDDGYKWEGDITSIKVSGTEESKTAEPKTVVLIVTSDDKELEKVTLGDDTNLEFSGPEDGGNKYTITIPSGSSAGTITVTLKAKASDPALGSKSKSDTKPDLDPEPEPDPEPDPDPEPEPDPDPEPEPDPDPEPEPDPDPKPEPDPEPEPEP